MKIFSKLFLPFSILLAMLFHSCSPQPKEKKGDTLRINIASEPQTLDPRKARDLSSLTVVRMLFEGLTRVGPNDKAELAAADSFLVSKDLRTYTFQLRKSYWSNKQQVTAGDFAYAWKKILDPKFPSDNAFQLYIIKNAKEAKEGSVSLDEVGIRVLDPMTLQIELAAPTPYFLELLATPIFFPVNQSVDQKNPKWADNASTYVGNGPFILKDWKHQDALYIEKNLTYWDEKEVKLSGIQIVMVTIDAELKMYEKRELDWAGSPLTTIPLDALKELKKSQDFKSKPMLGTYFIRTNTQKPPFCSPSIRKAFALAIDRKAIVDHVMQGNQIPATGIVPLSFGLQKKPYFTDGNQESAISYFAKGLEELKINKQDFHEVTLTYPSNERSHLIAQTLQQQWAKTFGIQIRLEPLEAKVYYDRISKQNFELASGSWVADFNDPINFLEVFKYKKASTNNTGWENPIYQELLDRSSTLSDSFLRLEILRRSEKMLLDDMPVIPIFYYTMLYLKDERIKNVVLSPMGSIDFKWASFEEKLESWK